MQNPNTGRLEPIPDDDPQKARPGWPIFEVGERVKFRGWWWEIEGFTTEGSVQLRAVKKSKLSGKRSRP